MDKRNEFKPEKGNFLLPNKTGNVEVLLIIPEQTSSNLNNGDKLLDVYDWENIWQIANVAKDTLAVSGKLRVTIKFYKRPVLLGMGLSTI